MITQNLLHPHLPKLTPDLSAGEAILAMHEHHTWALPVCVGSEYKGLLKEELALQFGSDDLLSSFQNSLPRPFVYQNAHLFDLLNLLVNWELPLMPVLDLEERFLGVVTGEDLLDALHEHLNLGNEGAIVVLDMNRHDYTLSHLARIAEDNNVLLTGVSVQPHPDSTHIYVTLRFAEMEISGIIESLERHDYNIAEFFGPKSTRDDLQSHYESLMHYLNI